MLEDKKKILDKNDFLNERKNAKIESAYNSSKRKYLILSVFLSLLVIVLVYLLTSVSNVKGININGNIYLYKEDILKLSGLNTTQKYIFINPDDIEEKIKTNKLIDACDVIKEDDQTITINIKEKKAIGYALEDGQNVLVLADDSRLTLDKSNLYLIQMVPLIEGFSKDEIILIEKNLVDVDYKMINEISDIHKYPNLKFQDHELIMRDGNYIFTSVYGLNRVNNYYDMANAFTDGENKCFYIEDISGNAYTSACPWVPQEEDKDKDKDKDKEDSKKETDEDDE